MSASSPPPPAYEEVSKTSKSNSSGMLREQWYRKLIALEFNHHEATEYANLFVTNEIVIGMIPELNNDILKSIGIEKAGHRIRILRLQNRPPTSLPATRTETVRPLTVDVPRCAWHPHVAANEKCRTCHRLLCLDCRRVKSSDGGQRYYCSNCYEECTIL